MEMENSTDIIFHSEKRVAMVHNELSHRSILCIRPQEIAQYFEISDTMKTKRTISNRMENRSKITGQISTTRVKHRKGANSIKMYNKPIAILRIETTINRVQELYAYRSVHHRNGTITNELIWPRVSSY